MAEPHVAANNTQSSSTVFGETCQAAIEKKFCQDELAIHTRVDRMFAVLMMVQWIAGMLAAMLITPRTWIGSQSELHPHVLMAVFGGGLLASLPTALAVWRPGRFSTRLVISISQVLFSSLLIHLTGGRIETHFHVFGSLAFLAAYRDWRVLIAPTLVVTVDHMIRGYAWPESVFGVATAADWRWLEHAGWVLFEDVVLLISIRKSREETHQIAERTANLELAKKAAEDSERRFRASFDQAAVGMCHLDREEKFLRINDRFCEITGYSREELTSMRWCDLTFPEDRDREMDQLGQLKRGEIQHFSQEIRQTHRLGHEIWVQITMSTVLSRSGDPSYFTAVVKDITTEVVARQQLLDSHKEIRKLSLVASKTRHSVVIMDAQGRAEWANDGFVRLTEFPVSELIGRRPDEFLSRTTAAPEVLAGITDNISRQQRSSEEVVGVTKSGKQFWYSLEIDPVFDQRGELTNFIATQADISERKLRETELRAAMERAEAANRAKSQFLANMSHEIRTPLNGIMGFTDLLIRCGRDIADDEYNEHLYTIQKCGHHLLELINEILDLSKIEAGKLQVERVECSPQQLIAETVSVLRVRAQEKGIALEYRWEGAVPARIQSDPHRLRQLLINLVGNAIKFTEQGSVVVVVYLDTSGDVPMLVVEVRDTGIGIPEEKLEAVFKPFMQADNSITRNYGGTGLGLTISRKIAEALGGSLHATSRLGVGSVFTARIATGDLTGVPMLAEPGVTLRGDIVDDEPAAADLEGVRILVVDDGETNRRLVGLVLERVGAKVKLADNGKVAVQLVRDLPFDAVLMDMQMPVLDGYAATRQLRQNGFEGPIVALTAHAMKGDRDKCEQAGCDGYLTKPIDSKQLLSTLALLTRRPATINRDSDHSLSNGASDDRGDEIRSLLPTDDPEIHEIVEEFVATLGEKVTEMEDACANGDWSTLAGLAHWLKGAGGTVGFACFTQPAQALETLVREPEPSKAVVRSAVRRIRSLAERIVLEPVA